MKTLDKSLKNGEEQHNDEQNKSPLPSVSWTKASPLPDKNWLLVQNWLPFRTRRKEDHNV